MRQKIPKFLQLAGQWKLGWFLHSANSKEAPVGWIEVLRHHDDDGCAGGGQKESRVPAKALGPFGPGARVVHAKFGEGRITSRSGTGDRAVVTVDFERVGTKKLVLKYAGLNPAGS